MENQSLILTGKDFEDRLQLLTPEKTLRQLLTIASAADQRLNDIPPLPRQKLLFDYGDWLHAQELALGFG